MNLFDYSYFYYIIPKKIFMKKSLILKYVAHKLAKYDNVAAEMQRAFGKETYLEVVKSSLISELPVSFKIKMEVFLRNRFALKKHRCVFYSEPTVEQWIADLTGQFSEDEVFAVFEQASGLSAEKFRTMTFKSNLLDRPFLEDIVEMLEDATGKKLVAADYLTDNDDYPYAAIPAFFATA